MQLVVSQRHCSGDADAQSNQASYKPDSIEGMWNGYTERAEPANEVGRIGRMYRPTARATMPLRPDLCPAHARSGSERWHCGPARAMGWAHQGFDDALFASQRRV